MQRTAIGHRNSSRRACEVSTIELFRRVAPLLRYLAWVGLMTASVLPHTAAAGEGFVSTKDKPSAVAVFSGLMTDNNWEEVFAPWTLDFRDSAFVGLAASHRISRFDDKLSFEIEGQVMRHLGDQDHWEFNLPMIGRWEAFPWDEIVDTSLAFGIGPSYASEKPKVEVVNEGDSKRLLVYWMIELGVGPPDKGWSAIFRLHHRSGAFGLVADEGGSNALVIGLKQQF